VATPLNLHARTIGMRHAVREMGELLWLRKVRLHYVRGQRHVVRVLEGVSLRIRVGEAVCVWGQRGQGKTTLLKMAAGLARPAGGEVLFEGRDLWAMEDEQRAGLLGGGIGWVDLAAPEAVDRPIVDHVAMPVLRAGGRGWAYARAREALEWVGASRCAEHGWGSLDEAERARVDGDGLNYDRARYYSSAAARFIAQDPLGQEANGPNVYLYTADDPTNAIDPYGTSIKPPSPAPPGGEGGEGGEGGSEGAGAGGGAGGAGSASAGGPGAHGSQAGCNPGGLKGNGLGGGGDWLRCPNEEDLERLNQEERDKENEEGGESEGDKIDDGVQKVCDLSGPTAAVALRKVPTVGSVVLVGCVGFTAGNLIRQGLGF
jgi:RHS repeat-associated protein